MQENDFFDCEKYHCKMMVKACLKRQQLARTPYQFANDMVGKYLSGDPGCRDCEQGSRIAQSAPVKQETGFTGQAERKEQSAESTEDLKGVEKDLKGVEMEAKKISPETKICKDPDCEHGGKPQPVNSFQVNHHRRKAGLADIRLDTCRDCMSRKRAAGRAQRAK